eukprot:scaffold35512_cov24-Phaeocystis_antarctica.AAC.2
MVRAGAAAPLIVLHVSHCVSRWSCRSCMPRPWFGFGFGFGFGLGFTVRARIRIRVRHAAVCAPVQVVHSRAVPGALGQVTEARGWVVGDPPPGVERLTLRAEAVLVILCSVQVDALVG